MRADQASVQRILSIIAAKSKDKITSTNLEKFGLTNPELKLKLFRDKNNVEEFTFGTHNPVTDEQYVAHRNAVYLVSNAYAEAAATQLIELIDISPNVDYGANFDTLSMLLTNSDDIFHMEC